MRMLDNQWTIYENQSKCLKVNKRFVKTNAIYETSMNIKNKSSNINEHEWKAMKHKPNSMNIPNHTHTHTYTCTYTYIYPYIYIRMLMDIDIGIHMLPIFSRPAWSIKGLPMHRTPSQTLKPVYGASLRTASVYFCWSLDTRVACYSGPPQAWPLCLCVSLEGKIEVTLGLMGASPSKARSTAKKAPSS